MAQRRGGEHLTLKDMIQGSGCTPRTVRYYEREGLLRAERSSGGHRLFAPGELERLNFIIALREAGWSLEEITALLSLRSRAGGDRSGDRSAARELEAVVGAQIDRLQAKISILSGLLADLKETRGVLKICRECTEHGDPRVCAGCDQIPRELPSGFRLTWLADGAEAADPAADEG